MAYHDDKEHELARVAFGDEASDALRKPAELRSTNAPPTLSRTPSLPGLLVGLRRRKYLAAILVMTLVPAVCYLAWTAFPAPKYMVRAMVHISSSHEGVLGGSHQESEARFSNFSKTQVTLVKSQIVLEAVVRNPDIARLRTIQAMSNPKDDLLQKIEVDFSQGQEILRITLKGDYDHDLVVLANAILRSYLGEFVNTEESRRASRLAQLGKLLAGHKETLNRKRTELSAYLVKRGGNLKIDGSLPDNKTRELELATDKVHTLQDEVEKLEQNLAEQHNRSKAPLTLLVSASVIDREIAKDRLVETYRKKIDDLRAREADFRSKLADAFAEEQIRKHGIREELAQTQQELDNHLQTLRPKLTSEHRERVVEEIDAEIKRIEQKLKLLREQRDRAAAEITALTRDLKEAGKESFQMTLVAKEVEEEEKLVGDIVKDIRSLNLQALAPPRARQLDKAVITPLGIGKKPLMITGASGAMMLGLILFGVSYWEFSKRKVDSVDEVIHGFGVSLVGTMPKLPRKPHRYDGSKTVDPTYSLWTESIDSYRMLLFRSTAPENLRVILVGSATAGEGKTSLSSHLAVSLARSGRNTLLIDGDMRKPTLHRLFGQKQGPGLAEVLRGESTLEQALRPTPLAGLTILPAGVLTATTLDTLARQTTQEMFEQLRGEFEVIVVDSSPLLLVADSLLLAQQADGVLLSLMRGVSRMPKLSAALHRLKLIGTPVLGAVVNGTDEDVYGTQYYVTMPSEV